MGYTHDSSKIGIPCKVILPELNLDAHRQCEYIKNKDLTMSLISHFFGSRLGRYVIGVLVAWILLFTIGYFRYGSTPGHPALHVFGGFLLGMLSMYIATRLYGTRQIRTHAYVIGVLVASILVFTIGYVRYVTTPSHPILQVFGGVLLGMLAMSIATRVYATPQNSSHA